MMKRLARSGRSAFTLMEMIIVIVIIVALAGTIGVVAYMNIKAGADKDMAQAQVNDVVRAVEMFHAKLNRYPTADKGLQELITAPEDEKEKAKWVIFLKDGKVPVDPWGNELKYELVETTGSTGPAFKVWSMGPDKQDGSDDDVRSWTEQK